MLQSSRDCRISAVYPVFLLQLTALQLKTLKSSGYCRNSVVLSVSEVYSKMLQYISRDCPNTAAPFLFQVVTTG